MCSSTWPTTLASYKGNCSRRGRAALPARCLPIREKAPAARPPGPDEWGLENLRRPARPSSAAAMKLPNLEPRPQRSANNASRCRRHLLSHAKQLSPHPWTPPAPQGLSSRLAFGSRLLPSIRSQRPPVVGLDEIRGSAPDHFFGPWPWESDGLRRPRSDRSCHPQRSPSQLVEAFQGRIDLIRRKPSIDLPENALAPPPSAQLTPPHGRSRHGSAGPRGCVPACSRPRPRRR